MIRPFSSPWSLQKAAPRRSYEAAVKPNPVRQNQQLHRFEMDTPAGLAVADYRVAGNIMTMFHTEVPVSLRNRGYGYRLVRGALEEVRRHNLKVDPQCWFVRDVIDRRPEFRDLLA